MKKEDPWREQRARRCYRRDLVIWPTVGPNQVVTDLKTHHLILPRGIGLPHATAWGFTENQFPGLRCFIIQLLRLIGYLFVFPSERTREVTAGLQLIPRVLSLRYEQQNKELVASHASSFRDAAW